MRTLNVKHLITGAVSVSLGLASLASAQPATPARQISASQIKKFKWDSFRPVAHSKSVPEVKAIQFLLKNQGFFKGQPDGIFHSNTARAVRAFQRSHGLKADGVVGSQTWQPLLLRLKKGDRGDAVRALQTLLREVRGHEAQYLNGNLVVDGIFGSTTEQALRIAQEQANWFEKRAEVDGIAGAQTWSVLLYSGYAP